jgi:hypothetical protein
VAPEHIEIFGGGVGVGNRAFHFEKHVLASKCVIIFTYFIRKYSDGRVFIQRVLFEIYVYTHPFSKKNHLKYNSSLNRKHLQFVISLFKSLAQGN